MQTTKIRNVDHKPTKSTLWKHIEVKIRQFVNELQETDRNRGKIRAKEAYSFTHKIVDYTLIPAELHKGCLGTFTS